MLLSIKSGALVCFASVILGAALIAARTHYSENENGFYKASDGNYYAYSRQGSEQAIEEEPSFFGWIIQGIKRMLGIAPATDPRQGQSFLGSLLSSGGWILPATGVAVAGVYREEISDIIEEIVDPSTAKPTANTTATPDPCSGVTCTTGFTAISNLGICQCLCGATVATAVGCGTDSNRCVSNACVCGNYQENSVAKPCPSASIYPYCGDATSGATPTQGDATATCQCTNSGTTDDTCLKSAAAAVSNSANPAIAAYDAKKILCGTTAMGSTGGHSVGACGKCLLLASGTYSASMVAAGSMPNNAATATCTVADQGCCANGDCGAATTNCPA